MPVIVKPGNSFEIDGTYFLSDIFDNLAKGSGITVDDTENAHSLTDLNNSGFNSELFLYGTSLAANGGTLTDMTMTIDGHSNLVFTGLDIDFAALKAATDLPIDDAYDALYKLFGGVDWNLDLSKTSVGATIISGSGGDDIFKLGSGDDALSLDGGNDKISLGGGDDTIYGPNIYGYAARGSAKVDGGAGDDTLFLLLYGEDVFAKGQKIDLGGKSTINGATVTFTHVENAYGASKADRITGDATANSLGGLGGNDILEGRGGADRLLGAAGKDVFVYARAADSNGKQHDTIADFKHNQDRIDLGALHPDTKNDKFTFIDDGKFDKHAGELHVVHKQGITMVEADLDGNGKADLQIELTGNIHLDKGDFIL